MRFENAEQFSEYLLKNSLISTVPWDDAGNYIRVSVTFLADDADKEDEVIQFLERSLRACKFIFH